MTVEMGHVEGTGSIRHSSQPLSPTPDASSAYEQQTMAVNRGAHAADLGTESSCAVAISRQYLGLYTKALPIDPRLLACSAVWIAAKFADITRRVPNLYTLCRICQGIFCPRDFVDTEKDILSTIGWSLHFKTFETCLQERSVIFPEDDHQIGRLAHFLGEVTLLLAAFEAYDAPSTAMGCLALAQFIVTGSDMTRNLGSPWQEVAAMLNSFLRENSGAIPTYIQKKYLASGDIRPLAKHARIAPDKVTQDLHVGGFKSRFFDGQFWTVYNCQQKGQELSHPPMYVQVNDELSEAGKTPGVRCGLMKRLSKRHEG
ncbi:hypothetical protein BKA70DRAFT_1240665 [Coprinopsis sp. MPI-PUGE-AT-0042]|nr:hypothetical protein BKA70DRAFT_1240665 [Coprinopsis sp. MPI-PUGE-AT-0042]